MSKTVQIQTQTKTAKTETDKDRSDTDTHNDRDRVHLLLPPRQGCKWAVLLKGRSNELWRRNEASLMHHE